MTGGIHYAHVTMAWMHISVIQVKVFAGFIMSAQRQHAEKARQSCTFITCLFVNL